MAYFTVTCAPGTALNTTTQSCDPCPVGYYQPLQTSLASVRCLKCPNQTTTLYNMTSNSTQCLCKYMVANSTQCLCKYIIANSTQCLCIYMIANSSQCLCKYMIANNPYVCINT